MYAQWRKPENQLYKLASAFLAGALLVLTSCSESGAEPSESTGPVILTTTSIWADVISNITCKDLVTVESIVPPGADPHDFTPSLAVRSDIDNAALVITNGLGLEEGLQDTLNAAVEDGAAVVTIATKIETLDRDPHIWFDPKQVAETLPWLAERILSKTDLDAEAVNGCTQKYQKELQELDVEIENALSTIKPENRKLVTNHDSLSYLANRYDLEVVATVLPSASSLAEASPASLEALARKIESEGIPAIFTDAQGNSDTADALAERLVEVEIIELYTGSLAGPGSGANNYVEMLRTNAELIASGLS